MADEKAKGALQPLYDRVQGCGLDEFLRVMAQYSTEYLEQEKVVNIAYGWRQCLLAFRVLLAEGNEFEKILEKAEAWIVQYELNADIEPLTADETVIVSPKMATD